MGLRLQARDLDARTAWRAILCLCLTTPRTFGKHLWHNVSRTGPHLQPLTARGGAANRYGRGRGPLGLVVLLGNMTKHDDRNAASPAWYRHNLHIRSLYYGGVLLWARGSRCKAALFTGPGKPTRRLPSRRTGSIEINGSLHSSTCAPQMSFGSLQLARLCVDYCPVAPLIGGGSKDKYRFIMNTSASNSGMPRTDT